MENMNFENIKFIMLRKYEKIGSYIPHFSIALAFFAPAIIFFIFLLLAFSDVQTRSSSIAAIVALFISLLSYCLMSIKEKGKDIKIKNERQKEISMLIVNDVIATYSQFKEETDKYLIGINYHADRPGIAPFPPCPIGEPIIFNQIAHELVFLDSNEAQLVHRIYSNFSRILAISRHIESIRIMASGPAVDEREGILPMWQREMNTSLSALQGINNYLPTIIQMAVEKLCTGAGENYDNYRQNIEKWQHK
ncbi:MAG: hypothetical protein ACEB74_09545 [Desulfovibrio aminophilus]|uniref:hypothetical protein n=1 Tax=Desulfovibrio aminophilus TaxID=81425 RepID=UPI0039E7909A